MSKDIVFNGYIFDRKWIDYPKCEFDGIENFKIKKISFKKGLEIIPIITQKHSNFGNNICHELEENPKYRNSFVKHYIIQNNDFYRNFIENIASIEFCVIYGNIGENELIIDGYYQGMRASKLKHGKYYIDTAIGSEIICKYYSPISLHIKRVIYNP